MKKLYLPLAIIVLVVLVGFMGCKDDTHKRSYFRKLERSRETIAVGIYKTVNPNPINITNIIEALKIDGDIVAVTLTDEDILRSELENIDVLLFPGLDLESLNDSVNSKVAQIIRNFTVERGKGTIGICGGSNIFSKLDNDCETLNLLGIHNIQMKKSNRTPGIIKINLSDRGSDIFPELKDSLDAFIDYHGDLVFVVDSTINPDLNNIAHHMYEENVQSLFITLNIGKGRAFLAASHPESTPGMRWMLPRMVRWVMGRELITYNNLVTKPAYFNTEILYNKEYTNRFEYLINQLDEKRKKDRLLALDELQEKYPWFAAEKVRQKLTDKNSEVRLRAAKFLNDIGYTFAIEDLETTINKERNKKNKEQFKEYLKNLEQMLGQGSSI